MGNTNGPLGAYLVEHHLVDAIDDRFEFTARQGDALRRPGSIRVAGTVNDAHPTSVAVTGRAVITDMYDPHSDLAVEHVELAHAADCVVIAPATAATLARLATGLAEDMLSVTALATTAPLVIAPAMEANMFAHPATQANLALLRERGATIVGPAAGYLASGRSGRGRMEQPETIVEAIKLVLGRTRDLAGAGARAANRFEDGPGAMVVAGTTGEAPTLSHGEKLDLFRAVVDVAGGKGKVVAGGSTISQQLARNLFLSREKSYLRKGQELIITWMLETLMDKQRIYEIYLNSVEGGNRV